MLFGGADDTEGLGTVLACKCILLYELMEALGQNIGSHIYTIAG
jgi:hypothetical protein